MVALAACPNVITKLGRLAVVGRLDLHERPLPLHSSTLNQLRRPHCRELH